MKSEEMLQLALADAIMKSVTPEVRDGVFKDAIMQHLIYTQDSKGRLTSAFEQALNTAAQQIAKELVMEPENEQRIRSAIQSYLEDVLKTPALLGKMVQRAVSGY